MNKHPEFKPVLSFRCRNADCRTGIATILQPGGPQSVDCPDCKQRQPLIIDTDLFQQGRPTRCAVCEGVEFFVRKDFPQRLGMVLVVLFGLTASIFYYYRNIPATFATLAALVVVDAAIYLFVGTATVCYRCRAEYRRLNRDTPYSGFDLATSEKYDVS